MPTFTFSPDVNWTWDRLRFSRSHPPGVAGSNDDLASLYRAALQQSQDLLEAARVCGSAARPLPLFYSLSQAGKAIEACYGRPESTSHGLKLAEASPGVMGARVGVTRGGRFRSLSACMGSGVPTEAVMLGALMASLPELTSHVDFRGWPMPLPLIVTSNQLGDDGLLKITIEFRETPEDDATALALLREYPDAAERVTFVTHAGDQGLDTTLGTRVPALFRVPLPDSNASVHNIDYFIPEYDAGTMRGHWLRPSVVSTPSECPPTPLMTWWVILFGLSMFARYHPQEWVKALDPDRSPDAVVLDRCMTSALERVPALVLDAVTSAPR